MKIAIDCRYLNKSGIGRALENILMNIDYSANQYFLIGKKELLDKYNATIIDDNSEPYSKNGLLSFPKEINKKCDCLFIPNFLVPYGIKIPVYTIMYDVIFLDLPKITTNGFIDYHIKYYLLKRCLRKSKKVFCISNFTKDRTAYHFKKYQDKLVVNYDGMSTKVLNYKVDKNIKKENQIVFVGNVKQHKGLITLLAAFKNREDKSLRLKIIGSKDNFLTGLKLNENDFEDVIFTNRISDEELFNEIIKSKYLVLPSLYEGFGLPPLEALCLGTQPVISSIPVFKELYSDLPVKFFTDINELTSLLSTEPDKIDYIEMRKIIFNKYSPKRNAEFIVECIEKDIKHE